MPFTEAQFTHLYESCYARIYRLCLGYCGQEAEAADLTQEVFIRAWQYRGQFRGQSKESTWLYRIAVNTCLMAKRQRKLEVSPLAEVPEVPAPPAEAQPQKEMVQRLYQYIHALPEADRLAISLVLDQVPYAEIASALGISEGNLRVRIHRIKARLQKALQHAEA